jgi:hypothetical protein
VGRIVFNLQKILPEGTSTETMGNLDEDINWRAVSKGALMGGWKENPNMASSITSEFARLVSRSRSELMVGISILLH